MDEYIQFLLEEELKVKVDQRFSNVNILCGLICLIAMVYSHFNKYEWPDNYYIVLGCVVVYYVVMNMMLLYQYLYEKGAFILFKVFIGCYSSSLIRHLNSSVYLMEC